MSLRSCVLTFNFNCLMYLLYVTPILKAVQILLEAECGAPQIKLVLFHSLRFLYLFQISLLIWPQADFIFKPCKFRHVKCNSINEKLQQFYKILFYRLLPHTHTHNSHNCDNSDFLVGTDVTSYKLFSFTIGPKPVWQNADNFSILFLNLSSYMVN